MAFFAPNLGGLRAYASRLGSRPMNFGTWGGTPKPGSGVRYWNGSPMMNANDNVNRGPGPTGPATAKPPLSKKQRKRLKRNNLRAVANVATGGLGRAAAGWF